MGNGTSSPSDAPDDPAGALRASGFRASQGEALEPGQTRRLPARLEGEALFVGLAHEASATARGACVLLGEGGELLARLGPGALLAVPGVSLTYADGCEVFEVRLSSLAECVRRVVFAAAPEEGGDMASPCEAFVALAGPEAAPQEAAPQEARPAAGGCAAPRCAPEVEATSGPPRRLQQLARMRLWLAPGGHAAHFVLSARSVAGSPFWALEASGAPLRLPSVGAAAAGASPRGAAASAQELLPLSLPPPLGPAAPAQEEEPESVITTPVRLYEDLLQRVRASEQQSARLSRALAEARDWNGGVADRVEAKEYELEVWRRQASASVGAWDPAAIAGLLEKRGWPLPYEGDKHIADLHMKVAAIGGKEIVCPRKHELLAWTSDADGYRCDACRKRLPVGSVVYCCRPCSYDECAGCYFGRLQRLHGPPPQEQGALSTSLRLPAALGLGGGAAARAAPQDAVDNDSESSASNDSAPLPEDAEVVDVQLDLRRPTGVLFDGGLSVRAVKARSQGERLNIHTGYRAVAAGGQPVRSLDALQGKLEALRSRGEVGLLVRFVKPSGTSGEPGLDHASREEFVAMQARASEVRSIDPGALPPGDSSAELPEPVECTLDLSQPLGLMIGDDLSVQHVQEGSQGEQQGIAHGWKVLSMQGEPVPSVQLLKERLAAERARPGSKRIKVLFEPSEEDDTDFDESESGAA